MFSGLSSVAVRPFSNLSIGYYAPLWVPVATQIVYRVIRYQMYKHMNKEKHFQPESTRMKQRDSQHRWFVVLEGAQILTFFALAYSDSSYLIPACYTLAHLVWTVYSKFREHIAVDEHNQKYWSSMDKPLPIAK